MRIEVGDLVSGINDTRLLGIVVCVYPEIGGDWYGITWLNSGPERGQVPRYSYAGTCQRRTAYIMKQLGAE